MRFRGRLRRLAVVASHTLHVRLKQRFRRHAPSDLALAANSFNLSLVQSNASGATFRGELTNDKSKERHVFGEIFTALPSAGPGTTIPPQGLDCGRIIVNSGFFQEIYTGGNFTSVATISPRFGGVEGVEGGIVYPSNMSDCVRAAAITHGCCEPASCTQSAL